MKKEEVKQEEKELILTTEYDKVGRKYSALQENGEEFTSEIAEDMDIAMPRQIMMQLAHEKKPMKQELYFVESKWRRRVPAQVLGSTSGITISVKTVEVESNIKEEVTEE